MQNTNTQLYHLQRMLEGRFEEWPLPPVVWEQFTKEIRADWRLPLIVAEACGRDLPPDAAASVMAVVGCMQIPIIHIDDILDEDDRGIHHEYGAGPVANLALAFQSVANLLLSEMKLSEWQRLEAMTAMAMMNVNTAVGQWFDSTQGIPNEENYWRGIEMKSTPFYRFCFELGSVVAGMPITTIVALGRIGQQLGFVVQLKDDVVDAMATPAGPDWIQQRSNVCLVYGHEAEYPEKERFIEILPKVADPTCLDEAQRILIQAGVLGYVLEQMESQVKELIMLIESLSLPRSQALIDLVKNMPAGLRELAGSF